MTAMDEARQNFACALAEVRQDAGSPSLAELARASDGRLTKSTLGRVLLGQFVEPPEWEFVDFFLKACRAFAKETKRSITESLFKETLWRRRHADLVIKWEVRRRDEGAELPPGVQRFPLTDVQPPVADLSEQPSQLLLARHEVVPFIGRVDELTTLERWRDGKTPDGQPIVASVALLHGAGGQGKTRLAAELARRTAVAGGWKVWQAVRTGTVTADTPRPKKSALGRNALVVIDYAERWPAQELDSLMGKLSARRGARLRVLLIARSESWWSSLVDDFRKKGYADETIPVKALPEGDIDARLEAFTVARERFADALGVPEKEAETIAEPGNLDHEAYGLTLTVHMAALVAVYAHICHDEPPRNPGALSTYLLDREYSHWAKLAQAKNNCAAPEGVMAQTVYTATLTRPRRLPAALAALKDALVGDPASHLQVLEEHAACYPAADAQTYLEPLYPDRLGEDFVGLSTPGAPAGRRLQMRWAGRAAARLLGVNADVPADAEADPHARARPDAPADTPAGVRTDAPAPEWRRDVLTNLINAAARWPHLAAAELAPLAREHPRLMLVAGNAALATLARIKEIPLETLEAIEAVAPPRDPDLDVGIAEITDRFSSAERIRSIADPAAKTVLYAKKAWRLSNSGRHDDALEAIEHAVELHRVLARGGQAEELSDLAWALNSLSNELHWTGRHRASLEAAEESVAIFVAVVQNHPEKIGSLAVAFMTLSLRLDQQRQTARGLELLEHAVDITRFTAEASPADFRPDLAGMLHNLGSQLSRLGRYPEALTAETEAVSIYRQLMEQEPRAHIDDMANALDGLAVALSGEGRHREALMSSEEAVGFLRAGAEDNPRAYEPLLANALLNLGVGFGESGSLQEAVRYCREAVGMSRELAFTARPTHLPLLARSVMNLGIWLGESGFHQEAVDFSKEAVALFRELVRLDSEIDLPNLAEALLNLGPRLAHADRPAEAGDACAEAVELYRRLSPDNPVVYRRKLAIALINMGNGHSRQRDPAGAVECFREAADLARKVAEDNPGAGLPILAGALTNLATQLRTAGLSASSVTVAQEAVAIRRPLAEADPGTHEPGLAAALVVLCDVLSGVGRHEEAAKEGAQAVAVLQKLAHTAPEAHRLHLALSLKSLGRPLTELNHLHQAVAVAEQEVEVWRHLAQSDPVGYEFELGLALNRLGDLLAQVGRHEEAVMVGEQAVALWRRLDHPAADLLLVLALGNLGGPLSALNRYEDVIAAGEEALPVWRRLAREDPTTYRPQLGHLLILLVRVRCGLEHGLRDALTEAEEAVEVFTALDAQHPGLLRSPLNEALQLRTHLRATVLP
ncbi:tetratricopeptide repeat protein [Streptomyces sp. NBC_01443]|uniref:tetratricopeptide repeat protein n=1 Tax=Streptomyces sp. NBC_01443 TaxID=2903868 RepID=UPI00224FE505|nr:tetratricopeptide repeat protein [Streptomyces sp. NBC_01443]MCX4633105.1 tetratricopeptide repeat protein [Streptomyces sp. NBC_01443]